MVINYLKLRTRQKYKAKDMNRLQKKIWSYLVIKRAGKTKTLNLETLHYYAFLQAQKILCKQHTDIYLL
jgi:transcriptional antiterminator Rof (Rho-off)